MNKFLWSTKKDIFSFESRASWRRCLMSSLCEFCKKNSYVSPQQLFWSHKISKFTRKGLKDENLPILMFYDDEGTLNKIFIISMSRMRCTASKLERDAQSRVRNMIHVKKFKIFQTIRSHSVSLSWLIFLPIPFACSQKEKWKRPIKITHYLKSLWLNLKLLKFISSETEEVHVPNTPHHSSNFYFFGVKGKKIYRLAYEI